MKMQAGIVFVPFTSEPALYLDIPGMEIMKFKKNPDIANVLDNYIELNEEQLLILNNQMIKSLLKLKRKELNNEL